MRDASTLDLFHDRPPAQPHSETSTRAAQEIASKVPAMESEVLAFLVSRGDLGATDEEIATEIERRRGKRQNPATWRARRVWLTGLEGGQQVRPARVVDSGRTRKTLSNRTATVWVATEHAHG